MRTPLNTTLCNNTSDIIKHQLGHGFVFRHTVLVWWSRKHCQIQKSEETAEHGTLKILTITGWNTLMTPENILLTLTLHHINLSRGLNYHIGALHDLITSEGGLNFAWLFLWTAPALRPLTWIEWELPHRDGYIWMTHSQCYWFLEICFLRTWSPPQLNLSQLALDI